MRWAAGAEGAGGTDNTGSTDDTFVYNWAEEPLKQHGLKHARANHSVSKQIDPSTKTINVEMESD